MKTIFVQIASYRDPECQWTVKDLFDKAAQPDRIHVGICWQYDPDKDKACFEVAERPEQVRISPFHWNESQGVCWARHQARMLWDGEDYILSIDSHTRFVKNWDEQLIAQLAECDSAKPILSNHPASYVPPDVLESNPTPTILRSHLFTPQGDLRIQGESLSRAPEKPLRGAFCSGGCIFASSDIIRDIPYDPYLYFDQEEISLSARFFTHGYDVFSLKNVLLYHYYRNPNEPKQKHPPMHWDDNPGWLKLQERARKRLNHLLDHTVSENPEIIRDIDIYNLGSVRSLKEFETYCGINFKNRTVSDRAVRAGFIKDLPAYLDGAIVIPEIDKKSLPAAIPKSHNENTSPSTFSQTAAIERIIRANADGSTLNIDREAPEGLLIIYDYIDRQTCKMLTDYADSQAFTDLDVVDPKRSTKDKIVTLKDSGRITNHVDIDGKAHEILNIFNDIHCKRMAPFYNVDFEWYERPQILRYPVGGKYNRHADADHWVADSNSWTRVQDRDYSVLLYLNDEYEGGELELVNQNFTVKPKPGMLLAFPSNHNYLHAALPTTSGIRYVIVSWAAVVGSKRVRTQIPYASVYIRQKRAV